jgi:50S ribosomal subunit-associated GTPase HflX
VPLSEPRGPTYVHESLLQGSLHRRPRSRFRRLRSAPNPLDELTGLAETAGTEVVAGILQRRTSPDQRTFIGKGQSG